MTPEQIEEAIYQLKIVATKNAHGELYEAIRGVPLEEIQFALRLALRLMDEPSKEMYFAGDTAFENGYVREVFIAMRDRLIEEVRDDSLKPVYYTDGSLSREVEG